MSSGKYAVLNRQQAGHDSGKVSSAYAKIEKIYFLRGKAYKETGAGYLLIPFSYEQIGEAYKHKGPS